jgi:hypothetical protein
MAGLAKCEVWVDQGRGHFSRHIRSVPRRLLQYSIVTPELVECLYPRKTLLRALLREVFRDNDDLANMVLEFLQGDMHVWMMCMSNNDPQGSILSQSSTSVPCFAVTPIDLNIVRGNRRKPQLMLDNDLNDPHPCACDRCVIL